jgi:head-tail adaptor
VESSKVLIGQPHEADLNQVQGYWRAGQEGATSSYRIWLSVFEEKELAAQFRVGVKLLVHSVIVQSPHLVRAGLV